MEETDLTEVISTAAAEPQSSAGDGESASSHPLPDLIKTDQYLATKRAAGRRRSLLKIARFTPGGGGPQ